MITYGLWIEKLKKKKNGIMGGGGGGGGGLQLAGWSFISVCVCVCIFITHTHIERDGQTLRQTDRQRLHTHNTK